ncbi:MAG: class III cytochrome c [Desulfobulbaceae bacterium]|nr:MAG: class III cytochrome c [Desulfobulbaceae bacterium]
MIRKALMCGAAAAFLLCGLMSTGFAEENKGPETITMTATGSAKPKPAVFPHKKHQELLKCGDCHHGEKDGKQVPYAEGDPVGKCESCHNAEKMAGKTKGANKLDTLKGAGHGNCVDCHKEMVKKDPALKEKNIDKCATCHGK